MLLDLTKNYFELFDLPMAYPIDMHTLSERYRQWQGLVHPDRHINGLDATHKIALQNASYVNQAYLTLKDPLLRADYLLGLQTQGKVDEQSMTEVIQTPEFLLEQMEFREELESVSNHKNAPEKLESLRYDVIERQNSLFENLKLYFERKELRNVALSVQKLQYFKKLLEEIKVLQFKLEDQ